MIRCLTKNLCKSMNQRGFSLLEMLMAVGFSVLLMTGVFTFYNVSSKSYSSGIAGQSLQDGANIILSKIIEGETENGVVYRLSTSNTYSVASGTSTSNTNYLYSCGGTAQTAPCNNANASSELYFCQDNPSPTNCNFKDSTARWYYLNSTSTSVIYHHPSSSGSVVEENIYTAPTGSSLRLRFSPPSLGSTSSPSTIVVEIDVALISNTASGAASTFVLLRNHL
jgi:hypothetical protein